MNVNHVDDVAIPQPTMDHDRLDLIFQRQTELMERYHEIEQKNGFRCPPAPLDLHDRFCQHRLKDFAWRVTEELTEAWEALDKHEDNLVHHIEELGDAFHFLIELDILSGFTPKILITECCLITDQWMLEDDKLKLMYDVSSNFKHNAGPFTDVVCELGNAMNCLKNKPWKSTHMLTDVTKYHRCLAKANLRFIQLASDAELSYDQLYTIYFKKSEVNKFRQRSNY